MPRLKANLPSRDHQRSNYASLPQDESLELSVIGNNAGSSAIEGWPDVDGSNLKQSMDESDHGILADGDEPSEEQKRTLRKISDRLPWSLFLVAIIEFCERFAYNGLTGPFQNYISNSYHDPSGNPGALGLHQSGATALTSFFQLWCYLNPLPAAIIADAYLGKYRTIVVFSVVYLIGTCILWITALPFAIENGVAFPGLIVAMLFIGVGTGGVKANVSPLIAEQYTETEQRLKTLKSGERVIVDPAITLQRIYMFFYLCINLGSLSALATTQMELHVGFWSAYLLAFVMFCVGFAVLVSGKKKYVLKPPQGTVITDCFQVLWIAVRNGFNLEAAKPTWQRRHGNKYAAQATWNDHFVDELKRALVACKVFLFYPLYWLTFMQMSNNFVSQAGQMELHGVPNDFLQNLNPIAIIVFIPLCERLIYPGLRRIGIPFKPITRIFWGFILAAVAMAYAAFVQNLVYSSPPCFDSPNNCAAGQLPGGGYIHNRVHIAIQTPAYVLIALSEILASITGLEYAYTKAPSSMKSFIMSMYLLTSAFGAAFAAALSPVAKDPNLTWLYTGLAFAAAVSGIVFWVLFSKYNKTEESMNSLERIPGDIAMASDSARIIEGPNLHSRDQSDEFDLPAIGAKSSG
ncbi:peptide transporter PTR2-A [Aulographum hederae CBS 113979]|uniref:Peptide transporter PTR2-A n=1 Tax=Aulographum hederae CBS 113979 TaxID=1176131 RepID=A0A6G1H6E8_9PEZI|nr:peptide transporter PTR2-A [Aulographum hederae CBS 113979]